MKEKGILLMAYGTSTYGKYAYNMAHSIKHFNKTIPIHLICDSASISDIKTDIFDSFDVIDFLTEDKKDYGLSKIKIFERSPFEKTLYLDVDGVCMNDVDTWFDRIANNHSVYAQLMGVGGLKDSISYNPWASNEVIWEKFRLKEDSIYPTLQTSVVYFDQSDEAKLFFEKLNENYKKRLNKDQYKEMWGRSSQHPDELYYSVTMAQMGMVPTKSIQPIFFPTKNESVTIIQNDHLILSMWGANTLVKPYAKDLYDRILFNVFNSIGGNHYYKAHNLYKGKFHTFK
jgi:hypothetical protein